MELGPAGDDRGGRGREARRAGRRRVPDRAQVGGRRRARQRRPHYLVCNADESEPGTFKDRLLHGGRPVRGARGMTIAAFATGAERGYVYIRAEYPGAAARMAGAPSRRPASAGLLGYNVMRLRLVVRGRGSPRRRAPTSRARRRRSSSRSRAIAPSPATSRRSR